MKLTVGGKLERPNVCFLCETTPAEGTKVVDTERYFDGFPLSLQGRRYVCSRCINQMVEFFGFTTLEKVELAEAALADAQSIIRGIKLRLDSLASDMVHLTESPNVFKTEPEVELEGVEDESQASTPGVIAGLRSLRGR